MMLESAAAMGSVKTERPDDAEIQEMAEKIRESNKVKMSAPAASNPQRTLILGPGGQSKLTTYMGARPNGAVPAAASATAASSSAGAASVSSGEEDKPMDNESQRGRFGWCTIATLPFPYIFRYDESKVTKRKELVKYCSVRMVEEKLLSKFFTHLHSDIHNLGNVKSYFLTDAEARLFNEINVRHCDSHFGSQSFTHSDTVVRMDDATDFYQFLEYSYKKIAGPPHSSSELVRCGFIRINNESVVPFTVKDDVKYVPLFYFEGETESLKEKAIIMSGWNLTYLKFCCKVQGIRSELYVKDDIAVISLDDIKSYFPTGTKFDDYWPPKIQDCQLFTKHPVPAANVAWTKQPTGAPPKNQPQRVPYNNMATATIAGTPTWGAQQARMVTNGQRTWPHTPAAYQAFLQQQQQQQQRQPQQQVRPPPLVRTAMVSSSSTIPMVQQRFPMMSQGPQKQLPTRVVSAVNASAPATAPYRYGGYGTDAMDLTGQQRAQYNRAKEIRPNTGQSATAAVSHNNDQYYFENHYVDGHLIPCIVPKGNYHREDPLITVQDFTCGLFPNLEPKGLLHILQHVLTADLQTPNQMQLDLMRKAGKYRDKDIALLIKHADANDLLPRIKYIANNAPASSLQQRTSEVAAKRMRIS